MPEREINSIADAVAIIDELIAEITFREEEELHYDETLQKAWNIIKNRVQ
tara:strand:+ start:48 stop:197 length:150 start_codon:yes stop_codon:yes gene_type:complete